MDQVSNLIIDRILKSPEKNAFYIKGRYYTYNQLGERIYQIRSIFLPVIRNDGTKLIGVVIDDDLNSYAACLSVLLSGFGYVPIDPYYPDSYINNIIRQTDIKIILTSKEFRAIKKQGNVDIQVIETSNTNELYSFKTFMPVNPENPAYVIYTSGMTGLPKGVLITRKNLDTFFNSFKKLRLKITSEDRFLQMSPMTFDMSILTFIVPLCYGACIYTIPDGEIKYISAYKIIKKENITFIAIVPATLSFLKPFFDEIHLPVLKYSLLCGEPLPVQLAEKWQLCAPNAELINIYGPTEATVFTHYYKYDKKDAVRQYNNIVTIGKPVESVSTLIIDTEGNEVPVREKGELCVAGDQLTTGYLKDKKKNKDCFFHNIKTESKKRYYRTGDVVFRDQDGYFYFVERKDMQVKIQGHRIELGEIEKHARKITQDDSVVVLPVKNSADVTEIILFTEAKTLSENDIINYLILKLPRYKIPRKVIFLDKIPLNVNGKIDRAGLSKLLTAEK